MKVLLQPGRRSAEVQRKMLDGMTLADLLERAKEQDERMYHI